MAGEREREGERATKRVDDWLANAGDGNEGEGRMQQEGPFPRSQRLISIVAHNVYTLSRLSLSRLSSIPFDVAHISER